MAIVIRPPTERRIRLVFWIILSSVLAGGTYGVLVVGGRTLAAILLGRYHRPRVEERYFLLITGEVPPSIA